MNLETIELKDNMNNIDCKIEIKCIKLGKHVRTYLTGLHYFLDDEAIKKLILHLKKKLGAGMDEKETNEKIKNRKEIKEYGFQGDHTRKIVNLISEFTKLTKDVFSET